MGFVNINTQRKILDSIQSVLKQKRWSWGQLASEVGIAKSYISQIKTETNRLNVEVLEKIANALEIPVVYLLPKAPLTSENRKLILSLLQLPDDISDEKLLKIAEITRFLSARSLQQLDALLAFLSPSPYSEGISAEAAGYAKVADQPGKYNKSQDS